MTDQLPPHDLDAESAFLGSLFADRDMIAAVADMVRPEAFFHSPNALIYRAMLALWQVRRPCDLVTLMDLLKARNKVNEAGGFAYITSLIGSEPTATHANYYGEIVMAHAKRRALIEEAAGIVKSAYAGDVDVDDLVGGIRRAGAEFTILADDEPTTFAEGMEPNRTRALNRWAGLLNEHIVPSGIRAIDDKTYGGFRGGDLIYIGAVSGMGKTSMAMQIALNTARSGRHALIVELEMTREALFNRAIAAQAGVPYGIAYQRLGDTMQRDRWLEASEQLESLPVTVETNLYTTDGIRGFCERAMGERPVDVVFIDHLDYLADPDLARENAEQRTAKTSKRLKRIAMELNIPIVVLSQLSRAVEDAPPYKPAINHLRYSGATGQDAEYVFLIYRRKFYVDRGQLESSDKDYIDGSNRHRVEVMVAKCRNGNPGVFELGWQPDQMKFTEAAA